MRTATSFSFVPFYEFGGAVGGRFAGENLLHKRITVAEGGRHVGERISQGRLLDIVVDGLGREQIQLERFAIAIAKFREAFAIRFRPLIAGAEEPPRIFEERAVERSRCAVSGACAPAGYLEVMINWQDFRGLGLRLLDLVVRADGGLPLRISRDAIAQLLLARDDRTPDLRVEERRLNAIESFPAVLNSEEIFADAPRVFESACGKGGEKYLAPVQQAKQVRHLVVAHIGEFVGGQLPVGFSGMAADESEFAIARTFGVPFQKMLGLGRLSIFVGAEDADIEIEARILEVIGIAAVERRLLLGREDDPHIVVAFVAIQIVNAALIERDHIGAQPGRVLALFLDRGDGRTARLPRIIGRHFRTHRALHPVRHILDRHEHVQFKIGRLDFVLLRLGVETVVHVIDFLAADFLQRVEPDVMICDHQPRRGNK